MFPNSSKGLLKAWRAAITTDDKIDSDGDNLTLPETCQEIDNWIDSNLSVDNTKMSLSRSRMLIYGAAKIYNDGITQLLKDLQKLDSKMIRRRRALEQDDRDSDSSDSAKSTLIPVDTSYSDYITYTTSPRNRKKRETLFLIVVNSDTFNDNSEQSSETETSKTEFDRRNITDTSTTTNADSVKETTSQNDTENQRSVENETASKKYTFTSDGESDERVEANLYSPTNSQGRTATKRTTGETLNNAASSSVTKKRKINEEEEQFQSSIGFNTLFKSKPSSTPITRRKTAIKYIERPSQSPKDFNVLYSENRGTPVTVKASDQNKAGSTEKSSSAKSISANNVSISKELKTSTAENLKESNNLTDLNVLFSKIPDVVISEDQPIEAIDQSTNSLRHDQNESICKKKQSVVERFEDSGSSNLSTTDCFFLTAMDENLLFVENPDSVAIDSDNESRHSIILPCSATQKKKDKQETKTGNVKMTLINKNIGPTKPEVKNQKTQTLYLPPDVINDFIEITDPDIEIGFLQVYNGQCILPAYYCCGVINKKFKEL